MKYVLFVIDTESNSGTDQEMEAVTAFNSTLRANGQLLMAEGIWSPDKSIVFDNRNGAAVVLEGPLHDLTEYTSGFWIIEAKDITEAKHLAAEASKACNRKVELRPLF